jgi:hypothetical protein
MATVINDKDVLLQSATVRLLSSPNNYIYFSSAAPVFNIDSNGVAAPTSYNIVAKLAGQLIGTVTWSVVSGTISSAGQSGNSWLVNASDLTSDTAVVRATLIYLGTTYSSNLTISKVTSGAAAVFADLVSENDAVATEADGTGYILPTGNSLKLYSGGSVISSGVVYSGTATQNGLTLTISNTTGVITLSATSWTSNQESFTLTATHNSTAYTATYTIVKSKRGNDAVLMDLISDADVVFAANDGTGYTLPTGNSARLYKGGVVLTTGVTYSGTTTKNGLTLTVNASTGELVLSGASWTSNQESFTVTAAYNALSYNIIYTIAKSKTGATGDPGPTGTTGSSSRICYTKTTLSSLSSTPTTITTTGSASFPPNGSWGSGTVWQATAPSIVAGESVYQSDGIYSPATGNTVWNVPYLSNLKVGSLSAITTDTGTLIIGTTGYVRGGQTAYNTGTGFFLGYSGTTYKFSIGSSTTSMTWDGSTFTITGGVIQTGTSGARLVMGGPSYQQALMGYNTSGGLTLGVNANTGQVFASNYTNGIAGDFDNTSSTNPALRGGNTSTGNGVAVEGRSTNYFGGAFYGGTTSAPLYLNPTGALPTKGAILGALCVVGTLLYFHNGTTWKQVSLI